MTRLSSAAAVALHFDVYCMGYNAVGCMVFAFRLMKALKAEPGPILKCKIYINSTASTNKRFLGRRQGIPVILLD
jgi:hypothetical protein